MIEADAHPTSCPWSWCCRAGAGACLAANDWPEWRGPNRDGTSTETNLPARWSPAGENVAWSLPFGGRRRRSSSATASICRRSRPATSRTTQERLVAVDADTGKVVWERRVSVYPQRRAAAPRRLGLAGRRSGHRQHLHVHGRGRAARVRARRQGAVGAIAARGVRRDHHARRPHDVADRRGRQGHPEHADSELGPGSRPAGQSLLRVRQAHRPDDLGQLAAGAPLRHELLDADRRRRQRRAAADRRRHRRRVPRASGEHRQAGVEPRSQQARDSQQRRCSATTPSTSRTAKRTSTPPRWAWSRRWTRPAAAC